MSISLIISLILKYGPDVFLAAEKYGPGVFHLVEQIYQWEKSGKTVLTPEDLALLSIIAKKPASDYLVEAGGPPAA